MPSLRYVPVVSDALDEDQWTGRVGFVHQAALEDFQEHARVPGLCMRCTDRRGVSPARLVAHAGLPPEEFYADAFTQRLTKPIADIKKIAPRLPSV